jgi:hypothetical protein
VPDLKLNEISDARERQAAQNGHVRPMSRLPGDPAAAAAALRAAAASATPRALWRHHRLFTILASLSLVPRVLAALAFRPAMLTSDSFLYMNEAAKGTLGQIRPSGYSWFLDIFQPLPHTLLAVTTVQHLMGIAIAAIVYGMLRYWGLPAWGACLAAAPTLFDTREIALESYILPDTLYTLMLLMAAALLLTKRTPRLWQCLLAGLFVAYVSVLRGNGLPLAVLFAIFILIRRVGWRSRCWRTSSHSMRPTGSSTSPTATASSSGRAPRASPTARSSSPRRSSGHSARTWRNQSPRRVPHPPGRSTARSTSRPRRTTSGRPTSGGGMTSTRGSTSTTTSSACTSRSRRSRPSPSTTSGSRPGT